MQAEWTGLHRLFSAEALYHNGQACWGKKKAPSLKR